VKLRKQAPAKGLIVAGALGLLLAFFGLVKSEPRIKAAPEDTVRPPVDYGRFFAPSGSAAPMQPETQPRPHTRTRAS